MKFGIIALGFVMLASCSEAQTNTKQGTQQSKQEERVINKVVSPQEFKNLLKLENRQLIDVRTSEEYSAGKIDNATNIDYYASDFKTKMSKLDKSKPVLVYCAAGGRSGKTVEMLREMGFQEVYDLKGGYGSWPFK